MMENVVIRKYVDETDRHELEGLVTKIFPNGCFIAPPENFEDEYVIAVRKNRIIGLAGWIQQESNSVWMHSVGVLKKYRKRGIATRLVLTLFRHVHLRYSHNGDYCVEWDSERDKLPFWKKVIAKLPKESAVTSINDNGDIISYFYGYMMEDPNDVCVVS